MRTAYIDDEVSNGLPFPYQIIYSHQGRNLTLPSHFRHRPLRRETSDTAMSQYLFRGLMASRPRWPYLHTSIYKFPPHPETAFHLPTELSQFHRWIYCMYRIWHYCWWLILALSLFEPSVYILPSESDTGFRQPAELSGTIHLYI